MNSLNRRSFFKVSIAPGVGLACCALVPARIAKAIAPLKRVGKPTLRLSLAAYSFREFFTEGKGGKKPREGAADKSFTMFDFVDYCADQGCEGAEVTSYYFPTTPTPDYFVQLKRHAFMRGIALSGTAVGNNFTVAPGPKLDQEITSVKMWIDRAATLGTTHIRVFAGNLDGQSVEVARKNCIAALEEACDYAGKKGIVLGLENHGGIVADPAGLLAILKAVNSPWFGANLDTGNFQTEDVYGDLEKCAPYAVNVQLKGEIHPKGQKVQPADIPRLAKILAGASYQGYVALEYESAENPWVAVPRLLGQMKQAFNAI